MMDTKRNLRAYPHSLRTFFSTTKAVDIYIHEFDRGKRAFANTFSKAKVKKEEAVKLMQHMASTPSQFKFVQFTNEESKFVFVNNADAQKYFEKAA